MDSRYIINRLLVILFISMAEPAVICHADEPQSIEYVNRLQSIADSLTQKLREWEVPERVFVIEKFGAKGDGKTVNTRNIQKAINKCSESGGGRVVFSKGDYVTGTIELKSNVMLDVREGCRLLGSTNLADYPEKKESLRSVMSEMHKYTQSLIYAEKANNIGICGKGEIYFRGERANFPGPETTGEIIGRPFGIRAIECSNIAIKDIFLHNSAAWMQNYLHCENLLIDGIRVVNTANYNNDGLDPDGCRNVIVRNCNITAEDDAMCLKGASGKPTENVLIENSVFLSTCNAFKIGTDTQGDFRNIVVRNIHAGGFPVKELSFRDRDDCSTGITIETVDGGNVENILMDSIRIDRSRCPIFIYCADRGRVLPEIPKKIGRLQNITVTNVVGEGNGLQGSLISGIPEMPVENLTFDNIRLHSCGGGNQSLVTRNVPVRVGYPDAQDFCRDGLPSYGMFIRYARNVALKGFSVTPLYKDNRPIIVLKDGVSNISIFNNVDQ